MIDPGEDVIIIIQINDDPVLVSQTSMESYCPLTDLMYTLDSDPA
jgi:hypothetical protein